MLSDAVSLLGAAGIESARIDAELLVGHVVQMDRAQLRARDDQLVPAAQVDEIRQLIARRCTREPVQYILGRAWFRDLELCVDPRVLIPRPETEAIVDLALAHVAALDASRLPARVLDVCTGSGAIALAIAAEAPGGSVDVTGADISADALDVARANAATTPGGGAVRWLDGDLLATVAGESFEVICANPPYIPASDASTLAADVRDHEPHLALFVDGDDEMTLVRRLAAGAQEALEPGGLLIVEIGIGQHEAAMECFLHAGLVDVVTHDDLAGIGRTIVGSRPC